MLINGLYNIIGLERHIVGGGNGIVGVDKGSVGVGKGIVRGNKGDGSGVVREQGENQKINCRQKWEKKCRKQREINCQQKQEKNCYEQEHNYGQKQGQELQNCEQVGERKVLDCEQGLRESERECGLRLQGERFGLQECGQGLQESGGKLQGERRVGIRLCGEDEIYKVHFPNRPITPGACLVQIAEELIGAPITQITHLKFLETVPPDTELVFSFVPKQENQYTITITGSGEKVDGEGREKDVNKGGEEIVGKSEDVDKNNLEYNKKDLDTIVTYARFVATYMRTDTDL